MGGASDADADTIHTAGVVGTGGVVSIALAIAAFFIIRRIKSSRQKSSIADKIGRYDDLLSVRVISVKCQLDLLGETDE